MLKSLLMASALTMAFSGSAMAQVNQIYNPSFEMGPTRPNSNLFMNSNTGNAVGWMDGGGAQLNVVQVDGGLTYGSLGPKNDQSGLATATAPRRYLDIANGTNTVFQRFTPKCSGEVSFGAWFSTRANLSGSGSLRIVQGNSPTGTVFSASNTINLPAGNSQNDPWKLSSGTVNLNAGQTYTFLVNMDNNLNMDEAYVFFLDCNLNPDLPDVPNPIWPVIPVNPKPIIDPCCPPFNAAILGESLIYKGAGSIGSAYTLEFDPGNTLNGHVSAIPGLQAYLNYLNAINPAINKLNIELQLYDQGNNQWPINHPNASGESYYAPGANGVGVGPVSGLGLTAGSTTVAKHVNYAATPNIFTGTSSPGSTPPTFPMIVGNWYMVHTGMWTDRDKFFGDKCANNDYYVRIQAMQKVGQGSGYVIQTLDKASRKIIERPAATKNIGR
jgi:hypothetical protein